MGPISKWEIMSKLRAIWAVRDPSTGEVLPLGLFVRYLLLGGAYVMLFFGFAIFKWDLGNLIHPTGGMEGTPNKTVALNTTTTTSSSWVMPATTLALAKLPPLSMDANYSTAHAPASGGHLGI